jgi:hypothetical protein
MDSSSPLRDRFAMAALPRLIPKSAADSGLGDEMVKATAEDAYRMADAMIEARKPKTESP